MKQPFRDGVIGDDEVGPSIAIVIGDGDTEPFARTASTGLLRNLYELAVTFIVVEENRCRLEEFWMAVGAVALRLLAAVDVGESPFMYRATIKSNLPSLS